MRENVERFGCYLCLDANERKTNALLWHYLAASLNNELGNMSLACEEIMLREQIDVCEFILDFIFDACPRRKRDDVFILPDDVF